MCGVCGIVGAPDDALSKGRLVRMTDALTHRGPDASGLYVSEGIAIGHRRLSIIDVSSESNQPFVDQSGRYVIVFNGEIYNYRELRAEMKGYNFRTSGDTEVVIAAFTAWGTSSVEKLKGMFAYCIWDSYERKAFIFRDRLGVKPLYYAQVDGLFLFSSELRSLLQSGYVDRKLDKRFLADYFSYQSFTSPSTPISGVRQLKGGCYLEIKGGQVLENVYWSLGSTKSGGDFGSKVVIQRKIRELLSDAVSKRLVSDVPIGAFLSGGIDSSAVVGLMAEASSTRPVTFNVSFEEEKFDESEYASIVARKFNTKHTTIRLSPVKLLDELENALGSLDIPSADGINTYVVSKAVREQGLKVALSGIGGDELFAGYPFFRQFQQLRKRNWIFGVTGPARKLVSSCLEYSDKRNHHRLSEILGSRHIDIVSMYPAFRRIISKVQMRELTRLGSDTTELETQLRSARGVFSSLPDLSQVSVAEYIGYTQNTLLKDSDQMSMAVALEVREPFFDHDLIEYVLQVPDDYKTPKYPKSLLVESLSPLLPSEIVHRKKQGFVLPWQQWLAEDLRPFCQVHIDRLKHREFMNPEGLQEFWERFLSGDKSVLWPQVWMLVVLEHWLEKNEIHS